MYQKIKEMMTDSKKKLTRAGAWTLLALSGAPFILGPAACGPLDNALKKLVAAGLGLLAAVGIIVAGVGIGTLVMQILSGLKGEGEVQMNKIATGVGFVAAGVVLFSLKTILSSLGINATSISTGL